MLSFVGQEILKIFLWFLSLRKRHQEKAQGWGWLATNHNATQV